MLCGAQGGRIEQMIKQQAAKEEESERQIRIIRHEKVGGAVPQGCGEGGILSREMGRRRVVHLCGDGEGGEE